MTMSITYFTNTKPKINKLTNKTKEWTHLEVLGGRVWRMLKWSWKSPSSSSHSIDGSYFFLWNVRNLELQDEVPLKSKERQRFSKMGSSKMSKNSRIWRNSQAEDKNQVHKSREVLFQARNGIEKEKIKKDEACE